MDFLYEIGSYGPFILAIMSFYFLWDNHNMFFYYTVGIFADAILNLVLKGIFQQPRPSEDLRKFNLALKHGSRFIFKDGVPYDIFGMPSGHAQSALFSTVFVYMCLKKPGILYMYLLITILIMIERVKDNFHTTFQVICGAIVGALFGHFMFRRAEEKIKGRLEERKDDCGPE